jgi:modulator of FtsH protease HflK
MSNQNGGGPWGGGGGRGGGPWGGGGGNDGGNGGGGGPWGPSGGGGNRGGGGGGMPQPPNIEEAIRKGQDALKRVMPGGIGGGRGLLIALFVIVALWLASGFYRVLPDEQGVVTRFGAYVSTTENGLHWHMPYPIEEVTRPKVTRVNRVEIGFRSAGDAGRSDVTRQVPEEALMLTGDENIIDINSTIFWVISDAGKFLFNVRDPEATVKAAAESVMREIVGQTPIASALAEGRGAIEARARTDLQAILDAYNSGIQITQSQLLKVDPPQQVVDSFRDVQRARADQERLRNEAEAYRNDIIPRARGEAEQLVQEAQAYKQEVVARSSGDAQRFNDIYESYRIAKDVTVRRIYLETMEEVLGNANKIIIDKGASNSGVLPYLPLPAIQNRSGGGQ